MNQPKGPMRQHLFAFGAMAAIGLPIQIGGGYLGFLVARAVTGFDWTQGPLETVPQTLTYFGFTIAGLVLATFPALYLWLRFLRGRVSPDIVYHWLTAGPQPPGLSQLARRAFRAVYGEGVGPGGRAV